MRISRSWLLEWLPDLGLDGRQLGDVLTMAGLELDALEYAAPAFSGVVVGRVVSVEAHPNADRLKVCRVEEGGNGLHQVVCGAPNVAAGMLAPYARVGAVLPNGNKIKQAKLRGVSSEGMLCSASELGLAESSAGLMELPENAPVGEDIREYLELDDEILEIDLTPNRADCLSMRGVAREASLLLGKPFADQKAVFVPPAHAKTFPVKVEAPRACPRYAGRVITGLSPASRSPLWLQERLRRAGIRSISVPVDVTNYVMLELGQPMHAFDLDKLEKKIRVRKARGGESIKLIDGQEVSIPEDTLVISDAVGPIAIAGIMGGQGTAVSESTSDIFLESAFFDPEAISGRARKLGLHTESSHRFERGVDPAIQIKALERASQLLIEIAGGEAGPLIDLQNEEYLPHGHPIHLRPERISQLLGMEIAPKEVERILSALGCEVVSSEAGWEVVPPSYRFDLTIEADLIEELARVQGYDRIPERRGASATRIKQTNDSEISLISLREDLQVLGYQEVVTYSFIDPEASHLFAPDHVPLKLANPISVDMSVMRPTLWPSLINVLNYNRKRQQARGRVFEIGLRFLADDSCTRQLPTLAGASFGGAAPEQWGIPSKAIDFFDIKGDVENLFSKAAVQPEFYADEHPALHPGQAARIKVGDVFVGWLGMLHPQIERDYGFDQPVGLFEIDLSALQQSRIPYFEPISKYPALRRDFAILVPAATPAGNVLHAIEGMGIEDLRSVNLFDVYMGEGIEKGHKSLAFGLVFQALSKNLTDQEVDSSLQRIIEELGRRFAAKLRG